ncbi:Transmembrane emp24 domain containing protein 2 precursor [Phytophthora palmivora]|uniref:Transmembrane emp24 domain containing protein 2 n=1 Tax=Phytophthora palmivora TaxID=4796 RepID=A0A2P4YFU4_9STRA|nr:Transmembrane emp24 domain containing protein 2 precursor [Phytophthora palmivora]
MRSFLSLVVALLLFVCALPNTHASRFQFTLTSRSEECFMEAVNARSSNNKVLFRFGILEPKTYDLVDVVVKNPSQREVLTWKADQNNHGTATVRESGLYHLCFRKLKGASSTITLFYSFDFISTGVRSLTLVPNIAATVSKDAPSVPAYTEMAVTTVNDQATKMGVMEFDLVGVSKSILRGNTRVKLLLTVDSIISGEEVDIALAVLPDRMKYPVTWETLESYANGGYHNHVIDDAVTELGSHVAFDITELFQDKLDGKTETIAFSIHANEDSDAVIFGVHHVAEDYFPQIVVEGTLFVLYGEDIGLELMHEVAYFKESVFTLRGDISFVKHRERLSRDAAESTNSRVKWMSLITNVVLVGIAFGQVVYIRSMLESGY